MATYLYPLNDLALSVTLKEVSATTGAVTVLTTGTVTGFLATSSGPTATAADPSLVATCNYSSALGKWVVTIDAAILTASLLNTHFAAATPYLILQSASNFRTYITLTYSAGRETVPA
jgi:hypothetical protein